MSDVSQVVSSIELAVFLDPAHHAEWTLSGAGKVVTGFSVLFMGWSAMETSGSAACTINVYDGVDTTGSVVLPIKLASGVADSKWYGPNGVWFKNGLYINLASGQAQGTVFFRHHRE